MDQAREYLALPQPYRLTHESIYRSLTSHADLGLFAVSSFEIFLTGSYSFQAVAEPLPQSVPGELKMKRIVHSALRAKAQVLVVVMTILFGTNHLPAQNTYPDLNQGGKVSNIQLNGSPALAGSGNTLFVAYSDHNNNGNLSVATSANGINYTTYTSNIAMDSDPGVATIPNDTTNTLYIAFVGQHLDILIYKWSAATGFVLVNDFAPGPTLYAVQPAIAFTYDPSAPNQVDLYLAWQGRTYDPSTGNYDGQWIDVAYSTNLGSSFTPQGNLAQPAISQAYVVGSGPALNVLEGVLYLSYLDAATGNAQLFTLGNSESTTFTNVSPSSGIGGHYAGNPSLTNFGGYEYAMFRSAYSSDNLWGVGISGNGYGYGPSYMYGQSLTDSPSLAFVGTQLANNFGMGTNNNGTLFQGGRTNYPGSGPYLWVYFSSTANTNPYPAYQGGGGCDSCDNPPMTN